ncbi:nucleic acid-binding protein [Streptomyces sp. NBRC 110611]|nr:nucleic acid-binding protein [Streptomyces sp. NBRC 110611]
MPRRASEETRRARESVIAERGHVIQQYRQGASMAQIHRAYGHPGEHWLARQFDEWQEPRGTAIGRGPVTRKGDQ